MIEYCCMVKVGKVVDSPCNVVYAFSNVSCSGPEVLMNHEGGWIVICPFLAERVFIVAHMYAGCPRAFMWQIMVYIWETYLCFVPPAT